MPTKEELIAWYENLRFQLSTIYNINIESPIDAERFKTVDLRNKRVNDSYDTKYVFIQKNKTGDYKVPMPIPERDEWNVLVSRYFSERNITFNEDYERIKTLAEALTTPVKDWVKTNMTSMEEPDPEHIHEYSKTALAQMQVLYDLAKEGNLFIEGDAPSEEETGPEANRINRYRQVYIDVKGMPAITEPSGKICNLDQEKAYPDAAPEMQETLNTNFNNYWDANQMQDSMTLDVLSDDEIRNLETVDGLKVDLTEMRGIFNQASISDDNTTIEAVENEFEKVQKKYLKDIKLSVPMLMDEKTEKAYRSYLGIFRSSDELEDYDKAVEMIRSGDFSQFESLSDDIINYVATCEFKKLDLNSPDITQKVEQNKFNPFFRKGLELASNTLELPVELRERAKDLSDYANEKIMQDTLAPLSSEALNNLSDDITDEAEREDLIKYDTNAKMTMAKTLLLAHLGNYHIMQKDGRNAKYDGSVTDSLAHGGRVVFTFGAKEPAETDKLENVLFRNNDGTDKGTAVKDRIFGTHNLEEKGAVEGPAAYKEKNDYISYGNLQNNYYINPAIGGLGKKYGNTVIKNDGTNGHMYIKMQESTAKKGGYLMVGFEGEEAGLTGKAGHKHTMFADKAKASAFMAGKGAPGMSKGGRIVDLSHWKPERIGAMLNAFNQKYNELLKSPDGAEKINKINEKLCGKVMNNDDLVSFLKDDLGIESLTYYNPALNKDVTESVSAIVAEKDSLGEVRFDALGKKSDEINTYVNSYMEKKMSAAPYRPGRQFQQLSEILEKHKDKLLKIDLGDSKEMKKVKNDLADIIALSNDKNANLLQSSKRIQNLLNSTAEYIDNPKKADNKRMKIVKEIRRFANYEFTEINKASDEFKEQAYKNIAENIRSNTQEITQENPDIKKPKEAQEIKPKGLSLEKSDIKKTYREI